MTVSPTPQFPNTPSSPPRLSLIVAVARNGVIGRNGTLPWRLPADLQHFKAVTMGAPIVMGRKTWESIGRPLPGRRNIVVSRRTDFVATGADVVPSLDAALALCAGVPEVFVIGGAELYAVALGRADRIHLTLVEAEVDGDTNFPALDATRWRVTSEQARPKDDKNEHAVRFQVLDRVGPAT
jgi:dihydrofolate reductase